MIIYLTTVCDSHVVCYNVDSSTRTRRGRHLHNRIWLFDRFYVLFALFRLLSTLTFPEETGR